VRTLRSLERNGPVGAEVHPDTCVRRNLTNAIVNERNSFEYQAVAEGIWNECVHRVWPGVFVKYGSAVLEGR